jgi:hypothetical protein
VAGAQRNRTRSGGFRWSYLVRLPGLGVTDDELGYLRRQLAGDDVGEGHRLEDLADVRPQRDPDVTEGLGVTPVLEILRALAARFRRGGAR